MKNLLFMFGLSIFLASSAFAAEFHASEAKEFSGVIVKQDWAKTGESYCQAGSDYYVLETLDGKYPLNSERDPVRATAEQRLSAQADMKELLGKKVIVQGKIIEASFSYEEHCPPYSQCIRGDIKCSWLRVAELKAQE